MGLAFNIHWHDLHHLVGRDVQLAHLPADFARHVRPASSVENATSRGRADQNIGDHFMVRYGDDVHRVDSHVTMASLPSGEILTPSGSTPTDFCHHLPGHGIEDAGLIGIFI